MPKTIIAWSTKIPNIFTQCWFFMGKKRKISNQKIPKSSRIIYLSRGKHQEKSSKHYHRGNYFTCLVSKPSNVSRMNSYFLPLGTRPWSLNCLMSSGWTYIFIDNTKSCTRMVNALVVHPRVGSHHEVWGNFSKKPLSPLICCGSFIPCWKINQSPTKKISNLTDSCSIAQFSYFPPENLEPFLVTTLYPQGTDAMITKNGKMAVRAKTLCTCKLAPNRLLVGGRWWGGVDYGKEVLMMANQPTPH